MSGYDEFPHTKSVPKIQVFTCTGPNCGYTSRDEKKVKHHQIERPSCEKKRIEMKWVDEY